MRSFITAQLPVVEQQIQVEVFTAHLQVVLAAHEGETHPQFQHKFAQVRQQAVFQIPLVGLGSQTQEVEGVRVFEGWLRQLGLRGGQGELKIGGGLPLTLDQAGVALMDQDMAVPAVLEGGAGVPLAGDGVFDAPQLWGGTGNEARHQSAQFSPVPVSTVCRGVFGL